ncbi:MAG: formate dehydrogenase accessory sulfurtransferase FdhD [Thermodesulfobacteriota bacterium]
MSDTPGLRQVACRQFKGGVWRDLTDVVTPEVRLTLVLDGVEKRLWAHPADLENLALGHALLDLCPSGRIPVLDRREGDRFILRTTAGDAPGAGRASGPLPGGPLAAPEILARMEEFVAGAGNWEATGCFHRAGILDPGAGRFLRVVEDIGRHNCMDRLAGWMLAAGEDPRRLALFASCRFTASLLGKVARAGFGVAVSRSALTTAALDQARDLGLTLAGFAREGRFTVFHDPVGRIADPGRT